MAAYCLTEKTDHWLTHVKRNRGSFITRYHPVYRVHAPWGIKGGEEKMEKIINTSETNTTEEQTEDIIYRIETKRN